MTRSRGSRTIATSLLDAQSATFDCFTLKSFFGGISLLSGSHFHETEASGFLGVRIEHDCCSFDVSIFFEHGAHFLLTKSWMNSRYEEIGSSISSFLIIIDGFTWSRTSAECVRESRETMHERSLDLPGIDTSIRRARTVSLLPRCIFVVGLTW